MAALLGRGGGPASADSKGTPRHPATVTLVIPVRNEARRLPTCLEAIRNQTRHPDEIIVVDGRSEDETVEIARRAGARVLFEDYRTRAGACHTGVEHATGDLVAFTDADCVPDPGWLETLVSSLEPGVVGVGGRIENRGDTFLQRSVDAALDTLVGSANSVQGRPFASERYVTSISGCNSLYRRDDLIAVGGFDTGLVTTEDTELNRRLLKRGKLLYVPDALVVHRHERGLGAFARRMVQYGYGRGQSLLLGPPLALSLSAVGLVALGLVRPWYALLLLALYAGVLVASAASAAIRKREAKFLASVPLVLVVEHACYVAGFWHGIVRSRVTLRRKAPSPQEDTP